MVYKHRGFKAASIEMNVSQSTVSEQVSLLEEYFEKTLFKRSSKNIELTQTGRKLYRYAEQIFKQSKEINLIIKEEQLLEGGSSLKIGMTGNLSRNLIYRFVRSGLDDDDYESFEIYTGEYPDLLKSCLSYQLDGIISMQPAKDKDLTNFESHVIKTSKVSLIGKKRIINKYLNNENLEFNLYYYHFPFPEGDLSKKLLINSSHSFNIEVKSNDTSLLRYLVNSGKGLAIMPEIGVREEIVQGSLVSIPLDFVQPVKFFFTYPKITSKHLYLEKLIKVFQKEVRSLKSEKKASI